MEFVLDKLDLRIDSNNDGEINESDVKTVLVPKQGYDGELEEKELEEAYTKPGKVILIECDKDKNDNKVPDYADNNAFSQEIFTPLELGLNFASEYINSQYYDVDISFEYSQASLVEPVDGVYARPTDGAIRLWKKSSTEARTEEDLICVKIPAEDPNDKPIVNWMKLDSLTFDQDNTCQLYIEAVNPTNEDQKGFSRNITVKLRIKSKSAIAVNADHCVSDSGFLVDPWEVFPVDTVNFNLVEPVISTDKSTYIKTADSSLIGFHRTFDENDNPQYNLDMAIKIKSSDIESYMEYLRENKGVSATDHKEAFTVKVDPIGNSHTNKNAIPALKWRDIKSDSEWQTGKMYGHDGYWCDEVTAILNFKGLPAIEPKSYGRVPGKKDELHNLLYGKKSAKI